jgi:superfamily II DNA or RNA helicase
LVYQAPTGSGKTILFACIIANAVARGTRVGVLTHRQEILDQILDVLVEMKIPHGVIAAGHPENPDAQVQVASVATVVRRLDRVRNLDLLVVDECHHAVARMWRKIFAAAPNAHVLGVTATPERLDGKGLSNIFETLICGSTVAELIAIGWLSPFTVYAPAKTADLCGIRTRMGDYDTIQLGDAMSDLVVIGSAVEDYTRLCPGAPAIAFCVNIKHSELVADRFRQAGYRAAHVDGETPTDERRRTIRGLQTGDIQVVTNCGLISEGLDVPGVVAVTLLRPTKSLALFLQQIGRALRPAPGRAKALILDHAGNSYRFGLPDADREWSLAGRAYKGTGAPAVCRCKECGAINPISAQTCGACGARLREPAPPRTQVEIHTGPLVPIETLQTINYGQALRWAGADRARLNMVAAARGYKPGWVWHRLQELAGGEDRQLADDW